MKFWWNDWKAKNRLKNSFIETQAQSSQSLESENLAWLSVWLSLLIGWISFPAASRALDSQTVVLFSKLAKLLLLWWYLVHKVLVPLLIFGVHHRLKLNLSKKLVWGLLLLFNDIEAIPSGLFEQIQIYIPWIVEFWRDFSLKNLL